MNNLATASLLFISGSGIKSIDLPAMSSADGLYIMSTPNLSSLKVPRLTTVDEISLIGTGTLESVSFSAGLKECNSFAIVNTKIQTLPGFDVTLLDHLELQDNPNLGLVLPNLSKIKGDLTLKGDYGFKFVSNLSKVMGQFTLVDAPKVDLPLLQEVRGNVTIENFGGKEVRIPIKLINGSLAVTNSQVLEILSLNRLESIGRGLTLLNNSQLALLRLQSLTRCYDKFEIFPQA
ncbi:cell wall protein Ecm33 [Entomophthora muscae]|uniref:Cell wall protein Ecm33 n=1 Tax=Entomophthora muscae TaxID=34485 RepID=A0ACC2RXL3_9FUNG|nr:cell wall protein Ecm33 [Entomophthora muscae]